MAPVDWWDVAGNAPIDWVTFGGGLGRVGGGGLSPGFTELVDSVTLALFSGLGFSVQGYNKSANTTYYVDNAVYCWL